MPRSNGQLRQPSDSLLENQPQFSMVYTLADHRSQSINQLYLNTVNGSASWFSDMPCDNYNL